MDFKETVTTLNLNCKKIGTYSFCTRLNHYYSYTYTEQKKETQETLQQITTNLEYVYIRFDDMHTDDSIDLIKKSCVKGFEYEFCSNRNRETAVSAIRNGKHQQAKAKLLWIINKLWLFRLK